MRHLPKYVAGASFVLFYAILGYFNKIIDKSAEIKIHKQFIPAPINKPRRRLIQLLPLLPVPIYFIRGLLFFVTAIYKNTVAQIPQNSK